MECPSSSRKSLGMLKQQSGTPGSDPAKEHQSLTASDVSSDSRHEAQGWNQMKRGLGLHLPWTCLSPSLCPQVDLEERRKERRLGIRKTEQLAKGDQITP